MAITRSVEEFKKLPTRGETFRSVLGLGLSGLVGSQPLTDLFRNF